MSKQDKIYRIRFINQGKVYEIYAREIAQAELYGFVEVAEIVFGERSKVIVDPAEQDLKSEFAGVRRSLIPMYAIVRIDEVEREGQARVTSHEGGANIAPFPATFYTPPKGTDKG